MTFKPFPKLARLSRECTITEKIDGTNAQVFIVDTWQTPPVVEAYPDEALGTIVSGVPESRFVVFAGSRTRWITPGKTTDNFGFAAWVWDNAQELVKLGPGRHFGEWWGKGIQRGYGLDEKRFSLFDTKQWSNAYEAQQLGHNTLFPKCCHVVPVLQRGMLDDGTVLTAMDMLSVSGSYAAPGFLDPEGIVLWHSAARVAFKKTFEHDENGKEAA